METLSKAPVSVSLEPTGPDVQVVRLKKSSPSSALAKLLFPTALLLAGASLAAHTAKPSAADHSLSPNIQIQSMDVEKQRVTVIDVTARQPVSVAKGDNFGAWTLMAVIEEPEGILAVFEELKDRRGSIIYVGKGGVALNLPKSLEPTTAAASTLYRGRTQAEIAKSENDILGQEFLAGTADPDYASVAAALPPLRVPSFVGTRESDDKPTFAFGAFSDEIYVDLGKLFAGIRDARAKNDVWEGLVGRWLPVNRFIFPVNEQEYWEETMFAEEPGHFWTQPIWYRALLVDGAKLKEAHYYYHHLPFPPRGEPSAGEFYEALYHVHAVWARDLNPPMKIDVPDARLRDFCLHALLMEEITRVGDHPKYGYPPLGGINVFGGYGYNNVDTFQDTFNTSVAAFLEWGLFDVARRYIDDYFTNSVREDGSIDTRGPEIGQYGKMLAVMAKYYAYTHDEKLMLSHEKKLEAIVSLFGTLRKQSKEVPSSDITYGIIRGWSEHDSSLKIDPYRFMQPHFSNNAEAARGFHDLGEVWVEMGHKLRDASLEKRGRETLQEAAEMKRDLDAAIERSIDRSKQPPYIPAVAGDTPTYGKERAYAEMLESAELTEEQARLVTDSLAARGESLFGLLRGGQYYNGFLDFGPAYARLLYDWPREFLLLYYAHRAHIYSRGNWTAVEGAKIDGTLEGPYCTPSEVSIPMFTKWMLVLENPDEPVVWLAKATPRIWLEQGKTIAVAGAPTRFGNVGYELHSDIDHGKISVVLHLSEGYGAATKLRLRVPGGKTLRTVTLNGAPWSDFSPEQEVVSIPSGRDGMISIEATY
ncbi:MAG TPA: hypothetical protein VMG82_13250 [Candidatus Sulfotelmatobacter sp.]|nr:hypothetical protein [Candidatus Sulfotelmatobacter sp.]